MLKIKKERIRRQVSVALFFNCCPLIGNPLKTLEMSPCSSDTTIKLRPAEQ
jgi:prepilin signal peptidase PulO-like enzyme (type II secretory pathway)